MKMGNFAEYMTRAEKRAMVFVDGTNLLIEMGKAFGETFRADNPPKPALALAYRLIAAQIACAGSLLVKIRHYWFGSYQGDDQLREKIAHTLRDNGFEPVLFKQRGGREKGVDIGLTKEMLMNAFSHNYEVGILVAGDEDYLSLVQEVKRYGALVWGTFFETGLSEELRLSYDCFQSLTLGVTSEKYAEYKTLLAQESE